MALLPNLQESIQRMILNKDVEQERISTLSAISDYISTKNSAKNIVQLLFVCTHNSRRSQFAQIWSRVAASYYGLGYIRTFSGGMEVTSVHPNVIQSLMRMGFSQLHNLSNNPKYQVNFSGNEPPLTCYSKTYQDVQNPKSNFCAIMACSDADRDCPVVIGADDRFSLSYQDPKISDGTDTEAKTYDEASILIAREMFYIMKQVTQQRA